MSSGMVISSRSAPSKLNGFVRKVSFFVATNLAMQNKIQRGRARCSYLAASVPNRIHDSARVLRITNPFHHCAIEPFAFLPKAKSLRLFATLAVFFFTSFASIAQVREIAGVTLTVADLDREIRFFKDVLAFEEVGATRTMRSAELKLGAERINLIMPITPGRPIPADSRSFDHSFQHIAIVVRDMDKAYAQLRERHVSHVSSSPQTLPVWNKDAGGIKAFYFRDPEDHVLEIIWFPPGKGAPKWQEPTDRLFVGIDHTAIVVSDTEKSLAFYRDFAGLRVVGSAENYGAEQEQLNQTFGAHLRITALRASKGPGIEFLEYMSPPGGKPYPADTTSNDLWFWTTDLVISGGSPVIIRDPDGHALRLVCKDSAKLATNSAQ